MAARRAICALGLLHLAWRARLRVVVAGSRDARGCRPAGPRCPPRRGAPRGVPGFRRDDGLAPRDQVPGGGEYRRAGAADPVCSTTGETAVTSTLESCRRCATRARPRRPRYTITASRIHTPLRDFSGSSFEAERGEVGLQVTHEISSPAKTSTLARGSPRAAFPGETPGPGIWFHDSVAEPQTPLTNVRPGTV